MADDSAVAMRAAWSESVNGALERIKRVRFAGLSHGEGFVVIVPAYFTLSHLSPRRFGEGRDALFGPLYFPSGTSGETSETSENGGSAVFSL
jgi:hypothetical protein